MKTPKPLRKLVVVTAFLLFFFATICFSSVKLANNEHNIVEQPIYLEGQTVSLQTAETDDSLNNADASEESSSTDISGATDDAGAIPDQQRRENSLAMLNYLTCLSSDLIESRGNSSVGSTGGRLKLETMYTDLFDNTRPDMVDDATLEEIGDISDAIAKYRMLDAKRDRITYLYEQQQAEAITSAIPNPVSVLNVVQSSKSIPSLVLSLGYMAVDSYSSYKSAVSAASTEYLTESWELDDEEATAIHGERKSTFNYMVNMVNNYNLPSNLALTSKAVEKLSDWKRNTNVTSRVRFLESNQDTYRGYGGYWLLLAKSYYEQENFNKCIDSIDSYESLNANILRYDYEYAATLPLAIAAASEVMGDDDYVQYAELRSQKIIDNAGDERWDLRYFAAQTYIDLYNITNRSSYLRNAYDIILDNVNELVESQRTQNKEFLAEFQEAEEPAGATENQKNETKQYNEAARKEHDLALPPVYKPLLINCDMLFALVDKLGCSEDEKATIEGILHPEGKRLFLTKPLDDKYRFSEPEETKITEGSMTFEMPGFLSKTKITLPAQLVGEGTQIDVTIKSSGGKERLNGDWNVVEVNRQESGKISKFVATFENTDASHEYKEGESIEVTVTNGMEESSETAKYEFVVTANDRPWIIPDDLVIKRVSE